MLSVIFAIAGGYAALALTGGTLTVYAQLGLVMLIGLTAKNAILMVEYANAKQRAGLGIARSAIGGAKARFRAVMMTAWSSSSSACCRSCSPPARAAKAVRPSDSSPSRECSSPPSSASPSRPPTLLCSAA